MLEEVSSIINEFGDQLKKDDVSSEDIERILEGQTRLADFVVNGYWNKLIEKQEAVDLLTDLLFKVHFMYGKTKEIRAAQRLGMETLTIDTHRAKSATLLAETKIPFATGSPTYGIVVAIVNDKAGIAASYRNTLTIEDFARGVADNIDNQEEFFSLNESKIVGNYIPPDTLSDITKIATGEAIQDFKTISLAPISEPGTLLYVAGLQFISPNQAPWILDSIKAIAGEGIKIYSTLGKPGGFIYGGDTHPQYSNPEFYNLH